MKVLRILVDDHWCVFQKNGTMKSHFTAQKAEVQMVLNFFSARLWKGTWQLICCSNRRRVVSFFLSFLKQFFRFPTFMGGWSHGRMKTLFHRYCIWNVFVQLSFEIWFIFSFHVKGMSSDYYNVRGQWFFSDNVLPVYAI